MKFQEILFRMGKLFHFSNSWFEIFFAQFNESDFWSSKWLFSNENQKFHENIFQIFKKEWKWLQVYKRVQLYCLNRSIPFRHFSNYSFDCSIKSHEISYLIAIHRRHRRCIHHHHLLRNRPMHKQHKQGRTQIPATKKHSAFNSLFSQKSNFLAPIPIDFTISHIYLMNATKFKKEVWWFPLKWINLLFFHFKF